MVENQERCDPLFWHRSLEVGCYESGDISCCNPDCSSERYAVRGSSAARRIDGTGGTCELRRREHDLH